MPNFILIDHSIAAEGGHYLEYARHVLTAAQQVGYHPVLVTNRAFPATQALPYEVHRVYERDIWGRSLARPWRRKRPRSWQRPSHSSRLPARLLSTVSTAPTLLVDLIEHERNVRSFARDTRQFLLQLRPERADIIFIPTLSEADLIGLTRCFRDPTSEHPAWHLLFRREIYLGHHSTYSLDSDLIRRIRRYLLRRTLLNISARFPRHRVGLYTDTDRLTHQYDRLGAATFSTLPIPVNPRLRPSSSKRREPPRVVTYLGDARSEKGYHLLPSVVDALLPELEAGAVRFAVQSNVAAPVDPPLDPRITEARERLRRFMPRFVTLREEPLDSSEYAEFVLASDIVLLPYDAMRYYARSSGVLAEALSAGIPVLVPAPSWMSDLLQPETARYHEDLLARGDSRPIEPEHEWRTGYGQDTEQGEHELALGFSASAISCVRLSSGDKYLLVQAVVSSDVRGQIHLRVDARFVGQVGETLSTDQRVIAASGGLVTSALFAVPEQTERVEFSLRNALGLSRIVLARPRLHVLNARHPVSIEGLGRTYALPGQIPDAIREMLKAFATYREHATEFATRSRLSESAARLVSRLTMVPREDGS